MADEKIVELVQDKITNEVKLVTTTTKVEIAEEKVNLDILQKKIENFNLHINNATVEKIRVQAVADEQITGLDKKIAIWQAEIAEMQKQIEAYGKLDFPKPEETEIGEVK